MSLFYKFQYLVGLTPWEQMPSLPLGDQAVALLDRVGSGCEPPGERALDLGCGTGFWSVWLARRRWEVTGVDIVPKAVRAARDRARGAAVSSHFIEGSITALTTLDIGSGFRLVLDFGAVHGLTPEQVRAVGREVTAIASVDATLLMYAFSPGHRGPLPRGIGREEIEQAYGAGWKIIAEESFDLTAAPRFVQKAHPSFYCLRRTGESEGEHPGARAGGRHWCRISESSPAGMLGLRRSVVFVHQLFRQHLREVLRSWFGA